ncbi:MAG: hypothetical protein R3C18_22715 [Planctomycetaceae bacterium]
MRIYFLALATVLLVCVGCAQNGQLVSQRGQSPGGRGRDYHAPPAEMLAHPGPMVGGPGPGVMMPQQMPVHQAGYMPGPMCGPEDGMYAMPPQRPTLTQVRFIGPEGMHIGWQIGEGFADSQLIAPARYNFMQGATYRLKISNIPGPEREGLTLYPSLHVYPVQAQTAAYLENNTLPIRLTDEDLDQVETNNLVTKVIYLPDARYQELAIAGVEELVSTRLAPGMDPVEEADKRGTIMAVVRIGNLDHEMPAQLGGLQGSLGGPNGGIEQVSGEEGQYVAPQPIAAHDARSNIPGDMMMSGPNYPGMPPFNPVMNTPGGPTYGYPITSTPIGLPGPPHLPLGRPATLTRHQVRNTTEYNVPKPSGKVRIDVRHEPGISLPPTVEYIQYTEKHPSYGQGDLSMPAWAEGAGGYCPPGQ